MVARKEKRKLFSFFYLKKKPSTVAGCDVVEVDAEAACRLTGLGESLQTFDEKVEEATVACTHQEEQCERAHIPKFVVFRWGCSRSMWLRL